MGGKVKSLEELRDSKLLYEKDMPAFGYLMIFIVLLLLLFVSVWGTTAKKAYVVKSNGVIQSVDKNYVTTAYDGEIVALNIAEGDIVSKGDILLTLRSADIDVQLVQLSTQKKNLEERIAKFQLLEASIRDGVNYFEDTAENSQYVSQYRSYISQWSQEEIDKAVLKAQKLSEEEIASAYNTSALRKSEVRNTALSSVANQRAELQAQLESIQAQMSALEKGKSHYSIRAPQTGTVHIYGEYNEGMSVQAGNPIASISPENSDVEVVTYLSAGDRSRVEEGDEVSMEIDGLIQSVYGTVSGQVVRIDSDDTADPEGKNRYFKVSVSLDRLFVADKEGHKVNLENGMATECRIVYDKMSYADYLLESLGVKAK